MASLTVMCLPIGREMFLPSGLSREEEGAAHKTRGGPRGVYAGNPSPPHCSVSRPHHHNSAPSPRPSDRPRTAAPLTGQQCLTSTAGRLLPRLVLSVVHEEIRGPLFQVLRPAKGRTRSCPLVTSLPPQCAGALFQAIWPEFPTRMREGVANLEVRSSTTARPSVRCSACVLHGLTRLRN